MSEATGQLLSVELRINGKLVQRNRERKVQNGSSRMNDSTKPSDKPSLPVTRYRLFKTFAVASCIRFDAATFIRRIVLRWPSRKFRITRHASTIPTGKRMFLFRIQHVATPLLAV